MRVQFLGTASSLGVPMIGCHSEVCCSEDPRDKRMRCAVLVEGEKTKLLIDCGPDIRQQLLRAEVAQIDGLLVTHAHADHLFGLDDLRPLMWGKEKKWKLPVWSNADVLQKIQQIFPWVLLDHGTQDGYLKICPRQFAAGESATVGEFKVTALEVEHGSIPTFGWLLETGGHRFAYFPDLKTMPEATKAKLVDVDLLVLDCLRDREHPTHLSTTEAIALAGEIGAKKTVFTHFCHEQLHARLEKVLPESMQAAFDGMSVDLCSFAW